ncbi:hypothetical protein ACFWDI_12045 [Streptomyces sp. NPDC060064]|uniref:hypothetical protein n=1 Tax=Streptomyces sp. NPDC060064 TaxID=3347049 RepID=UPI00367DF9BD
MRAAVEDHDVGMGAVVLGAVTWARVVAHGIADAGVGSHGMGSNGWRDADGVMGGLGKVSAVGNLDVALVVPGDPRRQR